jgi:dihydroneopterin aldolase/2-amino-4-hydroxy-6-hydroxymethyldihydropteridine diphosphokinase/dihydropteroate synthase/2-amino-4-hydroxy-6-hydroxymethyldihydropteridine diphosphokinase/dihydropteroate synthase
MHMRGNSTTMMSLTDYDGDLISTVTKEMKQLVKNSISAGVYRWNIMLDPGLGFAKDYDQNYALIHKLDTVVNAFDGIPFLIGPSRKGFVGKALGETVPEKRVFGTVGAVVAGISKGARAVRVHDVKAIKESVLVADECFRARSV